MLWLLPQEGQDGCQEVRRVVPLDTVARVGDSNASTVLNGVSHALHNVVVELFTVFGLER